MPWTSVQLECAANAHLIESLLIQIALSRAVRERPDLSELRLGQPRPLEEGHSIFASQSPITVRVGGLYGHRLDAHLQRTATGQAICGNLSLKRQKDQRDAHLKPGGI